MSKRIDIHLGLLAPGHKGLAGMPPAAAEGQVPRLLQDTPRRIGSAGAPLSEEEKSQLKEETAHLHNLEILQNITS